MSPAARPRPRPIAFAHRGASATRPENTLAAFELALEMGATGLESDGWLSREGRPMLVHDRTFYRPGMRVYVQRRTAKELAAFDVPTLPSLYDRLGTDFELSLDVQHPEAAGPILDCAEAVGAVDRLWLCHDDLDFLAALKEAASGVHAVCSTRPRRTAGGVDRLIEVLAARGIDVLNMHWRDWRPATVARTHELGLLAFAWDAQDEVTFERLLDLDVDAIYSDHPDRLVAAISRS